MSLYVEEAVSPPAFIWRTFEILSYGNFVMALCVDTASISAEVLFIFVKFFLKETQPSNYSQIVVVENVSVQMCFPCLQVV